jgi:hypothetical protein
MSRQLEDGGGGCFAEAGLRRFQDDGLGDGAVGQDAKAQLGATVDTLVVELLRVLGSDRLDEFGWRRRRGGKDGGGHREDTETREPERCGIHEGNGVRPGACSSARSRSSAETTQVRDAIGRGELA